MGFSKLIISGKTLEIYEYENECRATGRINKKINVPYEVVSVDREDTLPKRLAFRRPDNARRASLAFRRIVECNLGDSENPVFVSLTYKRNMRDYGEAYRDLQSFILTLRRRYSLPLLRYIAVPEVQKRGSLHFHTLIWGLPEELVLFERQSRVLATIWGQGFIDVKRTDGNDKIAGYMAKYMSKAFREERLFSKKTFMCSRNVLRPKIDKGNLSLSYIVDFDYVDKSLDFSNSFLTMYLGRCNYKRYKLN